MKWALKVEQGNRKGMIIQVQKSPFLIGRNIECHLRPASPYISGRHCEILTEDGKLVIRDCNSTNGTFINSKQIQGPVELHESDHLKIGALALVVCLEDLKPLEEQDSELASSRPSRTVQEETVEDILLQLDEEDTATGRGAWRNTKVEDAISQLDYLERKAEKPSPETQPKPSPSDVASTLLKGQGSLRKRRH
jgi:pSer/pThr/pTyr-binding forkhead associated (FHA) protein